MRKSFYFKIKLSRRNCFKKIISLIILIKFEIFYEELKIFIIREKCVFLCLLKRLDRAQCEHFGILSRACFPNRIAFIE